MFEIGDIIGVLVKPLTRFVDGRGWLSELFREDEVEKEFLPVMAYISVTRPGVVRGPHEHFSQADHFCFLGPSNFKIYLWDNRKSSATFMRKSVLIAGEDSPKAIIIPPGVVHAYKNVGAADGMVVNLPNKLYAGHGKKEMVDEIRHESDPDSVFHLD